MENISNKLFLHTFYTLAKAFVEYYPKHDLKCKRLQTFAVLEEFTDLNTPNLSKTIADYNKPFFFSRDWASSNFNASKMAYSYPVMVVFDRGLKINNPLAKLSTTCYSLNIAILDKYDRTCIEKNTNCGTCAKRLKNEIFLDTENFLMHFFSYMRKIVYVENTTDSVDGWYNRLLFADLPIGGNVNDVLTRQFQKKLKDANPALSATRWTGGTDDLYGVFTEMTFCVDNCDEMEYDPTINDFKFGYDRTCC